jgi:hypothetical protein
MFHAPDLHPDVKALRGKAHYCVAECNDTLAAAEESMKEI